MKNRFVMLSAICAGGMSWGVTVPVGMVQEVADDGARTYPARVVAVAEVAVKPQVTGEILEVGFRNGQVVKAGDLLYRIDPVKYIATEKNAEAKKTEIKYRLEYATTQADRYAELVKTHAVPVDDFDRVCSEREALKSALAAAEADLAAAKDDVKHCTITAPIAGRLGSTAYTEGNFVSRGGNMLVRLVQTDPVRVSFEVSSADYAAAFGSDPARIAETGRVELRRVTDGDVVATGRVEYVENVANAATDAVRIFANVPNAKGVLLVGQTVMARLSSAKGVRTAAVPPNAVALDSRGTYVWVVGADGRAVERRVVRGALRNGRQLVRSGLKPGESIVLDGVHRVKAGDEITAEKLP